MLSHMGGFLLKLQSWGPNSSLKAQILAWRPRSPPWSPNLSLEVPIPPKRPRSQPQNPERGLSVLHRFIHYAWVKSAKMHILKWNCSCDNLFVCLCQKGYFLQFWNCKKLKFWNCKKMKFWNCKKLKFWNCKKLKLRNGYFIFHNFIATSSQNGKN